MEISIEKTNENPYLNRKEVHGAVSFTGATPSHKQLADALATKLNAKAEAIFILHVFTNFGSQKADFEAHVYPSKEQLEKVVKLGKKAKEKAAGKAAPGAAPAAAPAPAPKAEEKKEAPKKEEPKKEAKPAEAAKPVEAKKEEPKKEAKPAEKPVEAKKEEPKKAEVKV